MADIPPRTTTGALRGSPSALARTLLPNRRRSARNGTSKMAGEAAGALGRAVDEACAVAAADGVTLSADAEWEIIESMPPLLTSSTARDIAAGIPSELDAITGAAVRAGQRLGVETPVLSQMFHEACRALSR